MSCAGHKPDLLERTIHWCTRHMLALLAVVVTLCVAAGILLAPDRQQLKAAATDDVQTNCIGSTIQTTSRDGWPEECKILWCMRGGTVGDEGYRHPVLHWCRPAEATP